MNLNILRSSSLILLVSSIFVPVFAQDEGLDKVSERAADLEAQVRKLDASTVEGANVLLELIDLYHTNARGFGLIRAGKIFVKTHRDHPRHKEIMLKLLDGHLVLSRNEDIVSTARQFLEFYKKDGASQQVARDLGEVLARQNKKMESAKAFEQAWRLSGKKDLESGYRSVRLFGEFGAGGAKDCGRLALEMLNNLNGTPAIELGIYAFGRCSYGNWNRKGAVAIGEKLIQRNLIRDPERRGYLHYTTAGHLWSTGQRVNAVAHYRKAWEQQRDNEGYLRQLIVVLYDNSAKAGELKPLVDDYKRRYPQNRSYLGQVLSNLAHTYFRDKQLPPAVTTAAQAILHEPGYRDVANNYVRWMNELGENRLPEAERILRDAFGKVEPKKRHFIRYALAFEVYRDRMKDVNRARNEVRQMLREESPNDSKVSSAMNWYLSSAPDEGAFRREAEELIKYAEANGHLSHFRSWMQGWAKGTGSTDLEKGNRKWFRQRVKNLGNNRDVAEWIAFDKAVSANKPSAFLSLSKKLNTERKFVRFHSELGFDYRHYAANDRSLAIPHYKVLAKRFPKDASRASSWLDASRYGNEGDRLEAVRHLLQAESLNDFNRWHEAYRAAHEAKDDNLLRQVHQYVAKAEGEFGKNLGSLSSNVNLLLDRNMTNEANEYVNRHIGVEPDNAEFRNAVHLRLRDADDNAKAREFDKWRKADNEQHGAFASDYAEILFAKKDWNNFTRILNEARSRQDQRPFRGFTFDAGKTNSWISSIRSDKEITEADKVRVLISLRDLDIYNYSIYAKLALLQIESQKPKAEIERLKALRSALLRADNGAHGWNTALGFAQAALSAGDHVGAATLLTAAQAYAGNVPASYKQNGRGLLAQAYSRIGGIGMTIDKDSPLAPLMEILLQLRLGDRERALEAYLSQRKLFDKHRSELPLELILFAAESHVAAGGDENHERVEDLLAIWLVKNGESVNFSDIEKASVRLLLARNYYKWARYDAARSEFTTVKNSYPDGEEKIEAIFGIGETFMAQKNYAKAEEIFDDLANSRDTKVVIRAEFMRGLLASRQEDRDKARNIFRSVLERVPDVKLANETLYNLAEVYGLEQRYMDQLQLLRAVGRLGQRSKRWHEPGVALSIVVQDSDLGISRGHTTIPVHVRTEPGGDEEKIGLVSGGAGKGLFMAEIPTALGIASKGDRVLQLKGNDVVTVDYPEEFKKEFRFHMLGTNEILIASDADFDAASSLVIEEGDADETFTDELVADDQKDEDELELSSEGRPTNQIKPGNFIYMRVKDADRDLTDGADKSLVKLEATSGDSVTVELQETAPSSGIFLGRAKTGELPAGALASDVSIESNPLMSIDKDTASAWISEPDGAAPKWLTVDLKDVYDVTDVTIRSPKQPVPTSTWTYRDAKGQDHALSLDDDGSYEAKLGDEVKKGKWSYEGAEDRFTLTPLEGNATATTFNSDNGRFEVEPNGNPHLRDGRLERGNQTPVRMRIRGSHDGRFWYELARFPSALEAKDMGLANGKMTRRVYSTLGNANLSDWDAFATRLAGREPDEIEEVSELDWMLPPEVAEEGGKDAKKARFVVWSGLYAQPKAGATRFNVLAYNAAIMVNGKLVLSGDGKVIRKTRSVDVFLEAGAHELSIVAHVSNTLLGAAVTRARENPNVEQVAVGAFRPSDFDLSGIDVDEESKKEVQEVRVTKKGSNWNFSIPSAHIRHVEMIFDEYVGQSLAINQVEVKAGDKLLVPTEADVLAMAENDVLEITAGDVVTASYVDEFARGGLKNRLLTKNLTATYYNAQIRPISYEFVRSGNGQVSQTQKDLMRIDPGERVVIEVTDYDMDVTAGVDKLNVEVFRNSDEPMRLEAIETGENTGVFRTEVDTSAEEEEGKLAVSVGDRVNLRYVDPQNTFPGHSFPREGLVFVRQPTDGAVRIVETRYVRSTLGKPKSTYLPKRDDSDEVVGFAYEMPLTVVVVDPDAAKDSLSTTRVKVLVGDGNSSREAILECELSTAFGAATTAPLGFSNWPLYEGRFVGQALLRLGGPGSPEVIPAGVDAPRNLSGGLVAPEEEGESEGPDLTVRVVNLSGADLVTAAYEDVDRPDETNGTILSSKGKMVADGSLAITGPEYEDSAELLYVGEKLYLRVIDPDRDVSNERDLAEVKIETKLGESETVTLEETLSHSGVFTGSFRLTAVEKPTIGNLDENVSLETFFGDLLSASYHDPAANTEEGSLVVTSESAVSIGADGIISSFSKVFADEELAVRTQFHVAESYFELFKSHRKLGREEEAASDLKNGRLSLKQLVEDYPDPKYAPRMNYLLGQFAQELKEWGGAIEAYETIVRNFPEHPLAADAQYKLAQAYEEAERFDDALEAYVTLASTYPKSPLIANAMIRISEYFYKREVFDIAAQVGIKFIDRFESHQWSPKMAFRVGQCHYKGEDYVDAATAFDDFVKRFPDEKLCSEALFWGGESYRMGKNVPLAFQRYNRCRWDFPESDAAKYSRGRLALPEMLSQFEKEANLDE
ncbi:MAG: tetratricopeptide repeat protein [Opitutales bacterium]|nr:tetratricopeptide repeat protein [Opitutales bacterium]